MAGTLRTTPAPLSRDYGRPAFIAHSGGNTEELTRLALDSGADFLEVDLWVHRGHFEARHERAAYPLPFLVEKWYLRRAPRHRFRLGGLMKRAAACGADLFFDFKNRDDASARLLGEALDEAGPEARPVASSQLWHVLRAVRETAPDVRLFYSIDVRAQLNLFLSVADRDVRPSGISCRHTLLNRETIERVHERGMQVVAWTVDDAERAARLAEWGVDAITTHRVRELRERIAPRG